LAALDRLTDAAELLAVALEAATRTWRCARSIGDRAFSRSGATARRRVSRRTKAVVKRAKAVIQEIEAAEAALAQGRGRTPAP
jgi:hypothetical protein